MFAQLSLHILAQHPAGVVRQRPDADHENGQSEEGHSCLERAPLEDMEVHGIFLGLEPYPIGINAAPLYFLQGNDM